MLSFSARLLAWYDHNARTLPWRVSPNQKLSGSTPDPYHVYLSEVMLQQTTVATVKPYFHAFLSKWPTVSDLARANIDDVMAMWAGLGYYSRARNLHAAANQVQAQFGGTFPGDEAQLKQLKGVGDYTAAAIASIAFDQRAVVVDGNVDRVIVRHENLTQPIADIKPEIWHHADIRTPVARPGDYAQAMMDLGATLCTPKNPQCLLCPVQADCKALTLGDPTALPTKKKKVPKPVRRGVAFVLFDPDNRVWVQRNPDSGLLGGMNAFPSTQWTDVPSMAGKAKASFDDWGDYLRKHRPGDMKGVTLQGLGQVRHTFTHFHLVLDIQAGQVPTERMQSNMAQWIDQNDFDDLAFPTLMKKVWSVGSSFNRADQGHSDDQ